MTGAALAVLLMGAGPSHAEDVPPPPAAGSTPATTDPAPTDPAPTDPTVTPTESPSETPVETDTATPVVPGTDVPSRVVGRTSIGTRSQRSASSSPIRWAT